MKLFCHGNLICRIIFPPNDAFKDMDCHGLLRGERSCEAILLLALFLSVIIEATFAVVSARQSNL